MYRSHVLVCGGTGCTSSGNPQIMEPLKEEIKRPEWKEVSVVQTGCHGLCALGPIMIVYPDASFYSMVKVEDIPEIVQGALIKGTCRYPSSLSGDRYSGRRQGSHRHRFLQNSTALPCVTAASSTKSHWKSTSEPAATQPLVKCSPEMTPDDVIQCLLDSGLRGRGGGGFPTGLKWNWPQVDADQKYVCCNADGKATRRIHGPFRLRGRPARGTGGYGHCRLRHWCKPGLHLCARRVSDRSRTSENRYQPGTARWNCWERYFPEAASILIST